LQPTLTRKKLLNEDVKALPTAGPQGAQRAALTSENEGAKKVEGWRKVDFK